MQLITNDGTSLAYTDTGEKNLPSIILIAGYSGIKEEWMAVKAQLIRQGWRVITLDCRNHGASSHKSTGLRISRLAMDLANLIDQLKLDDINLVGHSMGASIIWAYISLFGSKKIKKVITIDQSPKALNDNNWQFGAFDISYNNLEFTADNILATKLTAQKIDDQTWHLLKEKHQQEPFNEERTKPLLYDHLSQDWRDIVLTMNVPHLMLLGGASIIWGTMFNQYCQQHYQDELTQVHVIKNSGHLIHLEEPEIFNKEVLSFINA